MAHSPRFYFPALVIGLFSGLAAVWLCHPGTRAGLLGQALWRAEWATYDYRLSNAPSLGLSPDIVLVTIDETTFAQPELSVWPFPRRFHARVLDHLCKAGARLIGLDMVLEGSSGGGGKGPTPALGPDDQELVRALKRSGKVILAMETATESVAGKGPAAEMTVGHFPHPDFEDAALTLACVNIPSDLDDVKRRYWVSRDHQGEEFPTMALALASAYRGESAKALAQRVLSVGHADYPLLGGQCFLTRYRAPIGEGFTRISYYSALSGDFDPATVRGKIVLVGSSATLLHDLHDTPMSLRGEGIGKGHMAQMAGVEILANATDTVLGADPVVPVSPDVASVVTVVVAVVTALLLFWLRPAKALFLVWLPVCVLATVVTFKILWMRTVWVPLVPLLLGTTLSYGIGTIYLELTVERAQARLRRAWSKRVSPEVLQVILGNPGLTQIKGRRVAGTVFFSDLQDFTAFCHSCPPETVVARINQYLELATQVIRENGGTLHKFIGDGVMAVFGDPVPQVDHARRALAAALELQRRMAELRTRQVEGDWPMFMRIGLCTGDLVAGDIGSEDLLEYTVMGDTVSLASRLEAMNKEYGTSIMLSGSTASQVGEGFDLVSLGKAEARGRAEAIDVYTVREGQPSDKA